MLLRGDTKVRTKTGPVAIKHIRPGVHQVWSRDKRTGLMGWKPVVATYSNPYDETVRLTVHDLVSGAAQTIVSNRIHPFYVSHGPELLRLVASVGAAHDVATGGTWVEAQHLEVGARLFNEDGTASIVTAKTVEATPLRAYNLTVADFHTYFVAGNDNAPAVWVRNCNLASWRTVAIEMDHVLSGHTVGGMRTVGGSKTLFPETLSDKGIEQLIRQAFRNSERIPGGQGSVMMREGSYNGITVQMYYDRATKAITSAWPKY